MIRILELLTIIAVVAMALNFLRGRVGGAALRGQDDAGASLRDISTSLREIALSLKEITRNRAG